MKIDRPPATLLLGHFPRIVVPVARCLSGKGIPVYGACFSGEGASIKTKALEGYLTLEHPDDSLDAFCESLLGAVDRYGIDTVVPVGDGALSALAACDDVLGERILRMYPDKERARSVLDKSGTLAVAERLGVPMPRTLYIRADEEPESWIENLHFPVVVKPSDRGRPSPVRIRYFNRHSELQDFLNAHSAWGTEWMVQEYVPGSGVGVEVLMDRGRPVTIFQHRRLKELPRSGGVAVRCVSERPDPVLRSYAVELLKALEWQGLAMVEMRYDAASGRAALMEINGRCWGSIGLPIQCGVAFPYYAWQLLHGKEPEIPDSYPVGQRMRWLGGDLRRLPELFSGVTQGEVSLASAAKDVGTFGADFVNSTRDALWAWRDVQPAWQNLSTSSALVARQVGRKALKVFASKRPGSA
ncbi:ATP-grasp domain-containing protein [Halorhodospira halophila]|uniref:ATP-grasp domain-containing protein n=1 Tax=Halorhodospira halophila (strain DSM 244 / SL1) TaxID=349124 RepID=A1WXC1_HALHL|nr:ATP-grasp domain-containing protein [Halorhodospira halophila]ABM62333.1 protein of unknown function DUF201 [Halorhodospira halophila SL1]MBK1730066.1 hypothetical protein [Halorhodospira halophila]